MQLEQQLPASLQLLQRWLFRLRDEDSVICECLPGQLKIFSELRTTETCTSLRVCCPTPAVFRTGSINYASQTLQILRNHAKYL